ncbi:unnamed protein product, partial [Symbiodinium necroappetens]
AAWSLDSGGSSRLHADEAVAAHPPKGEAAAPPTAPAAPAEPAAPAPPEAPADPRLEDLQRVRKQRRKAKKAEEKARAKEQEYKARVKELKEREKQVQEREKELRRRRSRSSSDDSRRRSPRPRPPAPSPATSSKPTGERARLTPANAWCWCPRHGEQLCRKWVLSQWALVQHLRSKHGVSEEASKREAEEAWTRQLQDLERSRSPRSPDLRRPASPTGLPPERERRSPSSAPSVAYVPPAAAVGLGRAQAKAKASGPALELLSSMFNVADRILSREP